MSLHAAERLPLQLLVLFLHSDLAERPTCEVILTESPEALRKEMDPEAGITVIKV